MVRKKPKKTSHKSYKIRYGSYIRQYTPTQSTWCILNDNHRVIEVHGTSYDANSTAMSMLPFQFYIIRSAVITTVVPINASFFVDHHHEYDNFFYQL